mmetsp:Transcript_20743/g.33420  ORF Transcript_20743/g.33420 Transcript_20743/m.33420 type:complete len:219 (-) Transcript_20743:1609-2265(-)
MLAGNLCLGLHPVLPRKNPSGWKEVIKQTKSELHSRAESPPRVQRATKVQNVKRKTEVALLCHITYRRLWLLQLRQRNLCQVVRPLLITRLSESLFQTRTYWYLHLWLLKSILAFKLFLMWMQQLAGQLISSIYESALSMHGLVKLERHLSQNTRLRRKDHSVAYILGCVTTLIILLVSCASESQKFPLRFLMKPKHVHVLEMANIHLFHVQLCFLER